MDDNMIGRKSRKEVEAGPKRWRYALERRKLKNEQEYVRVYGRDDSEQCRYEVQRLRGSMNSSTAHQLHEVLECVVERQRGE